MEESDEKILITLFLIPTVSRARVVTESTKWAENPPCIVPALISITCLRKSRIMVYFHLFANLSSTLRLTVTVPGAAATTLHPCRAVSRPPVSPSVLMILVRNGTKFLPPDIVNVYFCEDEYWKRIVKVQYSLIFCNL